MCWTVFGLYGLSSENKAARSCERVRTGFRGPSQVHSDSASELWRHRRAAVDDAVVPG